MGVSVLAVMDLLASPFFLVTGIQGIISAMRNLRSTPRLAGGGLMLAVDFCVLAVGVVCAVTAMDLWRLRKRGRRVTIFLMSMFGVFAADVALLGFAETGRAAFLGGSAGFVFCWWAVLYLCLPGTRRKFESAAVKTEYVKAE
ncbi:MAG TPA: hypothetical protein VK812_00255 [Candidatus Binatus sp.]|nr:hypothetical protein [Candidatus Binatus sp.]